MTSLKLESRKFPRTVVEGVLVFAIVAGFGLGTPSDAHAFGRKKPKPPTPQPTQPVPPPNPQPTQPVPVPTPAPVDPGVVTSCQTLSRPGTFRLNQSLGAAQATCLTLTNVSGIELDCQGHTIRGLPAIALVNVSGFTIKNCVLNASGIGAVLSLANVSNGSVIDSSMANETAAKMTWIDVVDADAFSFLRNRVTATYQQNFSNRSVIADNQFTNPIWGPNETTSALIGSNNGTGNQILRNRIDGKADLVVARAGGGADDGVVLLDEASATVSSNDVKNVWDCGIETSGAIVDSHFDDNTISNANICGIGGWYWNSVRGSTFLRNTSQLSGPLFYFYRSYGLRPVRSSQGRTFAADTAVVFRDNLFEGNRRVSSYDPTYNVSAYIPILGNMGYSGTLSGMAGERAPLKTEYDLTGNIFRSNDFDFSMNAPDFGIGEMKDAEIRKRVIDGGSNRCGKDPHPILDPDLNPVAYPLVCSAGP